MYFSDLWLDFMKIVFRDEIREVVVSGIKFVFFCLIRVGGVERL